MDDTRFALDGNTASAIVRNALSGNALDREDACAFILDLDLIKARLRRLSRAWPDTALHAVAVKANPLRAVLRDVCAQGFGLEAASFGELHLALRAGCPPGRLVFDSPAKTRGELAFTLERGIRVNADNFQEIERIADLLNGRAPAAPAGLRINTMVGAGRIKATSTATSGSKFGIPLDEDRETMVRTFAAHPWLTALHAHAGSGGMHGNHLAASAAALHDLAQELNTALGRPQIRILDIGGGLPVADPGLPEPCPPEALAAMIEHARPGLAHRYQVVTEVGRWVHAPAGMAVSRVEYVKKTRSGNLAAIHLGADLLLRQCYQPEAWPLPVLALDPAGEPKTGAAAPWNLGGPLCFSGDVPFAGIHLPDLAPGDLVAVLNAGAYTFSMFSRYNTRQMPKILGATGSGNDMSFTLLKKREPPEQAATFWDP